MTRAAVFLDRDGVLNEVVERDGQPGSPRSLSEFHLAPDLAHVRRLKAAGLLVFIVTNQPDLSRGLLEAAAFDGMLRLLCEQVPVDDWRVCSHEDGHDCACRKPRPGMLHDLAHHWHVDLSRSYFVGDTWRDVGAARAAGCRSILLRRPYNGDVEADVEVATLASAVDSILEHRG